MTRNQKVNDIMLPTQLAPSQLTRVDINFARGISEFSFYNDDAKLLKNLFFYLSHSYQNNLFGLGTLDPHNFAKTMGYPIKYLQKKHPSPAQLSQLTEEQIEEMYEIEKQDPSQRIFDSVFENALFILMRGLIFSNGAKIKSLGESQYYESTIKNYKILDTLIVRFTRPKSGRGKDKIIYEYSLSEDFTTNLCHFYLKAHIPSYIKLRKTAGYDDLYIYLKNTQAQEAIKLNNRVTLSFNIISTILHLNAKYDKPQQKRYMKKAFDRINEETELSFQYEFTKGTGSKWRYCPEITFDNSSLPRTQEQHKLYRELEKHRILEQYFMHELMNTYRRLYGSKYNDQATRIVTFTKWLVDINRNDKEKKLAYDNATFKTFTRLTDMQDQKREAMFKKIYSSQGDLTKIFEHITPHLFTGKSILQA